MPDSPRACIGAKKARRLCSIPLSTSSRKARILVYAVIGRFPPYIGQLGAKTRRPRTPLRRLAEHARTTNTLCRHFVGLRRRNLRSVHKLGVKPSLPRTLARVGSHKASILPLLYTTRADADRDEFTTERALGPTLNGVTQYAGPRHTEWLFDDVRVPDNKPVAQLGAEALNKPTVSWSATQFICFLIESQRVIPARMFDRVFWKAQWLLSCQIPSFDAILISKIRDFIHGRVRSATLPSPLKNWLQIFVSVMPKQTPNSLKNPW